MKTMEYYEQRLITRIGSEWILILATLFLLLLAPPASAKAKKIKGSDSLISLELCRASVDKKKYPRDSTTRESWGTQCCSKEQGYCIECLTGKDYCTQHPYSRKRRAKGIMTPPAGQVVVPTEEKPLFPPKINEAPVKNAPTTDKPKRKFPDKMQKLQANPTGTVIN